MKFFAAALLFISTAMALPSAVSSVFPVPAGTTMQSAEAKCGTDAKVSCCNKTTYTHDITNDNSGLLAGVLQSAIGGGPGGDGLGLFDGCSDLSLSVPVLDVLGQLTQLDSQKCKQTIACCQNSPSSANGLVAVALPCVALGSLL